MSTHLKFSAITIFFDSKLYDISARLISGPEAQGLCMYGAREWLLVVLNSVWTR